MSHRAQADLIKKVAEHLTKKGYLVDSALNRIAQSGPDIIATKGEKRIIVEATSAFPSDWYPLYSGVGQLIFRMDEYGLKNTKFYLAINRDVVSKVAEIIYSLGIGLLIADEVKITEIDRVSPPPGVTRKKYREKEAIKEAVMQIRCRNETRRLFNVFVAEYSFKDQEAAIVGLLDLAEKNMSKPKIRYI